MSEDPFNDDNADPFDPTDQEVEPAEEDEEEGEAAAESSDPATTNPGAGKTPAQRAVAPLNGDQRSDLVALAHGLNIPSDDPAWLVVRAALDAQNAAHVATQAAEKLVDVPTAIEKAALDGASRAAGEIQQHAATGAETIVGSLAGAIERAAAQPLTKLLKPYVDTISEQAGEITKTLRIGEEDRIRANADEFLRRVSKRIDSHSTATKTAGRLSAIALLALGAALGVAGVSLHHRLSPTPVHQTATGGYKIMIPRADNGKFVRCGAHECVDLYPSKQQRAGK